MIHKDTGNAPLALSLEVVGCSHHCRHCETSYCSRREHLRRDRIRSWADRLREDAARLGQAIETGLNNAEVLDHPRWRGVLSDLGQWELGPGLATNGRRISREPAVLDELKARGVAWLQLTLGGGSPEIHDWFTRRTGSFDCLCRSAELAHARGLHVAWVYIAYRPLAELARMSRVAQAISWEHEGQDYAHKGGIDQCVFLVKPQGEGRAMEDLRPRLSDLASLPPDLTRERFARSFGAGCETEGELVVALCDSGRQVGCLEQDLCGGVSRWVVSSNGDAYPYCHERHPHHLLGNLSADGGLARALERFRGSRPPPALAIRRRGLPELAAAYGDRRSDTLHSGCSLCRTLVARALAKEYP